MTNKQKTLNWASNKVHRNMAHMITELNMVDEKQLKYHLNRMVRHNLISYIIDGKKVYMFLTKFARKNWDYLVA